MSSSQRSIDQRPFKFHKAREHYPHNPDKAENRAQFLIQKANLDEEEQISKRRLVQPIRKNLNRLCKEELGKTLQEPYTEPMEICLFIWPGVRDGSFKGGKWCFWTLQTECQTFILSSKTRKYYAYLGPGIGLTEYPIAESVSVKSRRILESNHKMLGYLRKAKGIGTTSPTNTAPFTSRCPTPNWPSPMQARLSTLKRKKPSSPNNETPLRQTRQKLQESSISSIAPLQAPTAGRRPARPLQDVAVNASGPPKSYRSTQ